MGNSTSKADKFEQLCQHIESYSIHVHGDEDKREDTFNKICTLLANFDINTCDKDGKNLLHRQRCHTTNQKILNLLLRHGIDINRRDHAGKTPLFYVLYESTLRHYVEHGADLSVRDHDGHSVLYYAKTPSWISALIRAGKSQGLDIIDYTEYPLVNHLHQAVLFQDLEKMKELIRDREGCVNMSVPINVSVPNQWYWWNFSPQVALAGHVTPLFMACCLDRRAEFDLLLEHGADPQEPRFLVRLMDERCTSHANLVPMVKQLIDLGADVHATNDHGENVLHRSYRSAELTQMFLQAGADVHGRTHSTPQPQCSEILPGAGPLHYASVYFQDPHVADLLLKYGADPNLPNPHGVTPFMALCSSSLLRDHSSRAILATVEAYLNHGANVHLRDHHHNTVFDHIIHNHELLDGQKKIILRHIHAREKCVVLRQRHPV